MPINSVAMWTLRKAPACPLQNLSAALRLRAVSEPFDRLYPDPRIALRRIRLRRLVVQRRREHCPHQEIAFPAERQPESGARDRALVRANARGDRRRLLLCIDL